MAVSTSFLLLPVVIFMTCQALVVPRVKRTVDELQWSSCANDSVFQVHHLEVSPMPIQLPGTVHLTMSGESTRQVDNIDVSVEITKLRAIFGYLDFKLPCIMDIGSCTYTDMCALLEQGGSFVEDLEDLMDAAGAPLRCPLEQSLMSVENYPFVLPDLPTGFGLVVKGDYKLRMEMRDHETQEVLACFEVVTGVEEAETECTGWFCW